MTLYSHYNEGNLTVVLNGDVIQVTKGDPNFDALWDAVRSDDEAAVLAASNSGVTAIASSFSGRLSDEVTIKFGRVFWKDVEVSGVLSKRILELAEANEDTTPLVRFLEKVQQNPNAHSRTQLFEWLQKNDEFTIDEQGEIIAYKSVRKTAKDGVFQSMSSGTAYVNDVKHTGHIPQKVGDVVTMPREEVTHDPSMTCSTGLHAASKRYATTWTSFDALLLLAINPRDVVSVPTDASGAKMRVCRYRVIESVENTHQFDSFFHKTEADDDWYNDDDDYEDEDYDEYEDEDDYEDYDDESESDESEKPEPQPLQQLRKPSWRTWFASKDN